MFTRKSFAMLVLLFAITSQAQNNFTYTPEKPKPGDIISFTYEPAGDIANTILPVEALVEIFGNKSSKMDDLKITRSGKKYTGTIITDTSVNFLYLGFSADNKYDNNFNEGYTIIFYDNDKPRKESFIALSQFYQYMGSRVGVERNNDKALEAMEKEFINYPESKRKNLYTYTRLQSLVKKDEAAKIIQKEVEWLMKEGLKDESDFSTLENLYTLAKLPEQTKFVSALKKEKFPDGNWVISETMQKFQQENDLTKKKEMLAKILFNIETNEKWSAHKSSATYYKTGIASSYMRNKDWINFKKEIQQTGIEDKSELASLYNSAAWEMQKTSDNLDLAEEFSRIATEAAREQWKKPTREKPGYLTQKQWLKNNEYIYAMYADTYAMVMYRMGNYKKGLLFARESALTINKGKDPEQNNTYALLAEKTLPKKTYVKEIEQFVKDGKSSGDIKDILKRAYVKNKKSVSGFEEYIAALEKESYLKMLEELRKSMINETAPMFALLDLNGKKISLTELKGKTVIVDFWATWCGPCIASFPGMQKMVNKYKDDNNVKFVFIDTWERGDAKEKNAAEFIEKNKYNFHVLMDNDDKIVAEFKVEGIPTKFVIDKKGMIRFKSVGYNGSDDKLIQELTAMIEMADTEEVKKAF